ncbi:low density lipoprotein receptor adapter protein 1-B-like [Lineus longissimus]|uniref:low density lipoprotein receptor adapter protein 1-B-like n=1 Tax=Lineus longissimus TaxID=88925 RepID=UPI002B4DC320
MASILRTVKSRSEGFKIPFGRSNHKKLGEGWGENKEPIKEGVTFYLKYLGSTLVEELTKEGDSYGEGTSSGAVKRVVSMAKSQNRKLKKVALVVSPSGIKMVDLITKRSEMDLTIDRIRFCTADSLHEKVFAFIARNTINETMECHAYLCAKKKMAQAVTLTVAQAFNLAFEKYEDSKLKQWKDGQNKEKKKQSFSLVSCRTADSPSHHVSMSPSRQTSLPQTNGQHNGQTADLLSMPVGSSHGAEGLININSPRASNNRPIPAIASPSASSSSHSSSLQNGNRTDMSSARKNWVSFDDEGDSFSSSAWGTRDDTYVFSTDLREIDIDADVHMFLDGKKSREEFSRQKSLEDLLSL